MSTPRWHSDPVRRGVGIILIGWLTAFAGAALQDRPVHPPKTGEAAPGLAALESRLLELTNAERQARGLRPVCSAPDLVDAARRHSLDMAAHLALSHLSSNGRSLEDRLVAAGAYFSAAGESVALSSVSSAEAVHKSLLDDPLNRENILNPGFDLVGIGAERSPGETVFATEDFTTRLVVLNKERAVRQTELVIQDIRRKRGVTPIFRDVEADAIAQRMAEKRAAGVGIDGEIPFGDVRVLLVESGFFQDIDKYADAIGSPRYLRAGLGVVFRRTREIPGGAYIMVLVLLPKGRSVH